MAPWQAAEKWTARAGLGSAPGPYPLTPFPSAPVACARARVAFAALCCWQSLSSRWHQALQCKRPPQHLLARTTAPPGPSTHHQARQTPCNPPPANQSRRRQLASRGDEGASPRLARRPPQRGMSPSQRQTKRMTTATQVSRASPYKLSTAQYRPGSAGARLSLGCALRSTQGPHWGRAAYLVLHSARAGLTAPLHHVTASRSQKVPTSIGKVAALLIPCAQSPRAQAKVTHPWTQTRSPPSLVTRTRRAPRQTWSSLNLTPCTTLRLMTRMRGCYRNRDKGGHLTRYSAGG